jgi:ATP-binding cassette, subfamily B, bacterial MsbA
VVLLVACSYVVAALAMIGPFLMAAILDIAFGRRLGGGASSFDLASLSSLVFSAFRISRIEQPILAILLFCVAYIVVGVVKGLVEFANNLIAIRIRVPAALAIQRDLFRHVLSLSLGFFTRQRAGDLAHRLEWDPHNVTGGLETLICTCLTAPVLIVFYGWLLLSTSPKLVGVAVAAVLLHTGVTKLVKDRVLRTARRHAEVYGDVAARIQEAILSIRIVKSLCAEGTELRRLAAASKEAMRAHLGYNTVKHLEEPTRAGVNAVVEGGLILFAANELLSGRLTAPTFFLFLYVGRAVMVPVGQLASAVTQIYSTLGAASRVFELLDELPRRQDGDRSISSFREAINLEHVTFSYGEAPVLQDVSFEIGRTEMVALVGPSGVGKSTIADLILGLYDATVGRITMDGVDVREFSPEQYRGLFGVVSQEALLFNTTVRENIAYGRPRVTEEDVVQAARVANAHDFVMELPQGYETIVGDRGIRLSGGQRQRIAIARAVVTNPQILILDEATSFLDAEAERLVQEAIERITKRTTTIVIAHRLSTILRADRIVVLSSGRVEAIGRHDELMNLKGTYARLFDLSVSPR